MAIDSRTKRAAVLGVARPWMRGKNPDATKGEDWRINTGNAYGGNALSAGVGHIIRLVGLGGLIGPGGLIGGKW